jgi:shikimate kinase
MAVLSMFYGIIVSIYYFDNKQHRLPHIHVTYGEQEVVVGIPDGNIIEGDIQANKMKLLQAWLEIHKDELLANWNLAVSGNKVFKIEPLK